MKKLAVSLWISLYPLSILAQISTVSQTTDQHQKPLTIHEILYQDRTGISPNQSVNDTYRTDRLTDITYIFNTDTTWSYNEAKWQGFEDYEPGMFTQHFDVGTETDFVRHSTNYRWENDSTGWVLSRKNMDWIKDAFKDSSKNYDTDENGDPTYGSFYIYSRNPTMGATSESFYHRYDIMLGWVKDSRYLSYSNEDGTITWSKNYRYNADSANYFINNENMREDLDSHYLYEYKSYAGGMISFWTRDFWLYNEDGSIAYTVDYSYNSTFSRLDPTDSTAYVYNEEYAEAFGYKWYTDVWEWDNYTRTYETPAPEMPHGVRLDSVVTYEVFYDSELDSMVTGIVLSKTEYLYDANNNLIESIYSTVGSNGFAPFSRHTYTYELIDGVYYDVLSQNYSYSYITMGLYLYSEWHNLYDEFGERYGDMSFFFTDAGDTTSGYKSIWYMERENYYSFRYSWDLSIHEFVQTDFMVEMFDEPVSFFGYTSTEFGSDRMMNVINSLPAAMNPGPLFLAIDDTVDVIIRAYNPDRTIPNVSMTGIPATATFDPVTRRFYWVVDEEVEGPFHITATQGMKSTTIDVKVVFNEFTVGSETDNDVPVEITLYQNYPNPFNPSTTIGFELSKAQNVTLTVFNILGQPVQTLVSNELMSAGLKELSFNAHKLSSGIYYYRLEAGDKVFTNKMTLVK